MATVPIVAIVIIRDQPALSIGLLLHNDAIIKEFYNLICLVKVQK
jgi:hypothetical protein